MFLSNSIRQSRVGFLQVVTTNFKVLNSKQTPLSVMASKLYLSFKTYFSF